MPDHPRPLVRAASLVVAVVLVVSTASCTPRPTLAQLERTLYATSLPAFRNWWRQEHARAQHVGPATVDRWLASETGRLDAAAARTRPWNLSTDLCSFAPDTGPVFDFRIPCIRHDFAWRNLRRLQTRLGGGIDTRARRQRATRQFLRDMQATCAIRPVVQRPACQAMAGAYFHAVSAVS
ncbi:phospholipase A2 [Aquihabitans daechungensis]|uniref:phospholipase A2 n=1 Tax=Aquihabitans daechungensis TaxID=1052257 RepID=UPI003BA0950B